MGNQSEELISQADVRAAAHATVLQHQFRDLLMVHNLRRVINPYLTFSSRNSEQDDGLVCGEKAHASGDTKGRAFHASC
jgi:hypothetical protein